MKRGWKRGWQDDRRRRIILFLLFLRVAILKILF
jgi:hypothetical protein